MPVATKGVRRAFSLIELLVVIFIIAVLMSILLPALKHARESGRSLACMVNVKGILTAGQVYAQEYKDKLWYDWFKDKNNREHSWARDQVSASKWEPGVLYQYINVLDKVTECPANKRRGINNRESRVTNLFGGGSALDFDYCQVTGTGGAKLGVQLQAGIMPATWVRGSGGTPDKLNSQAEVNMLQRLPAVPVFVEESTDLYNDVYRDGLWGNWDQWTPRHSKGGWTAYWDGQVGLFKPKTWGPDMTKKEDDDSEANDIYVSQKGAPGTWYRVYGTREYGWINAPK